MDKQIIKKTLKKAFCIVLFTLCIICLKSSKVHASQPTDEILKYTIIVDVMDDASLNMTYNISWKVLESDSAGPLSFVKIGIPNRHCSNLTPISTNISRLETVSSGGNFVRVDFDRSYYEGEVVDFSFKINQNNVYLYNNENNTATYSFTPGWFDDIRVDNLNIMWNSSKVETFSPNAYNDNGYIFWTTSLDKGAKYDVRVTYNANAYNFNTELTKAGDDSITGIFFFDFLIYMIVFVFILAVCCAPIFIPVMIVRGIYNALTGFSMQSEKKITRTLIEYYPSCPNCGGTRKEGSDKCEYCDSSMIKNTTIINEDALKQLRQKDNDILSYNTTGEYKFKGSPNTYMKVNVISVPHIASRPATRGGSSHHSSCAHSSCACACACACAGGGRAGCSTKDFYNTNLKLRYIKNV